MTEAVKFLLRICCAGHCLSGRSSVLLCSPLCPVSRTGPAHGGEKAAVPRSCARQGRRDQRLCGAEGRGGRRRESPGSSETSILLLAVAPAQRCRLWVCGWRVRVPQVVLTRRAARALQRISPLAKKAPGRVPASGMGRGFHRPATALLWLLGPLGALEFCFPRLRAPRGSWARSGAAGAAAASPPCPEGTHGHCTVLGAAGCELTIPNEDASPQCRPRCPPLPAVPHLYKQRSHRVPGCQERVLFAKPFEEACLQLSWCLLKCSSPCGAAERNKAGSAACAQGRAPGELLRDSNGS